MSGYYDPLSYRDPNRPAGTYPTAPEQTPQYQPYQYQMMYGQQQQQQTPPTMQPNSYYASPSSNPHTGLHPSSYGRGIPFAAAALGANSSTGSSSLGMSVSPPHWVPGNAPWAASGSFVGSLGALGTSFGRERDRELEAKYVKDFTCCGRQLNGLHDLLEHYEEEHANLAPEARMAAITAVQAAGHGREPFALPLPPPPASSVYPQPNSQYQHGEVPTPPGMMDIEMDEDPSHQTPMPSNFLPNPPLRAGFSMSAPPSPWATAFRPQGISTPPQCLPPSLLSYNPGPPAAPQQPIPLTAEQLQAKAVKKAQRKAERAAAREEASASDLEGEKRFPCPIEGCGKVYKQANGLKYHLTRSINSGHGNVAAIGGLSQFLNEKSE